MSNVPSEVGKVASSAIDALKGQPACLAAILLAACFAVLTYMSLTNERAEMHQRQMTLIERCFPLAAMSRTSERRNE